MLKWLRHFICGSSRFGHSYKETSFTPSIGEDGEIKDIIGSTYVCGICGHTKHFGTHKNEGANDHT